MTILGAVLIALVWGGIVYLVLADWQEERKWREVNRYIREVGARGGSGEKRPGAETGCGPTPCPNNGGHDGGNDGAEE